MIRGIIYKYTSPSGKVYIGQTLNEKKRRQSWFNLNRPYAGPKINAARKKYLPENFEYEVIFRIESLIKEEIIEMLNNKERQYIQLFDSIYNGYNISIGGDSTLHIYSAETKKKISERAKLRYKDSCNRHITSEAIKEYYTTHKSVVRKPVLQFSIEGMFIREWESAKAAGEALGIHANRITTCCKGHRNHAGNSIWKYKTDFTEVPLKISIGVQKGSTLPVYQYNSDGILLKQWTSITEAAKELGYSLSNFSTYCNGRNNHEYKGFYYFRGQHKYETT